MKNLLKIIIASVLVLGFTATASGVGSGAFGGSVHHINNHLLAAGVGSGAFGG